MRCGFTKKGKFNKGFEILDADKDGLITENELKAYFVNQNYGNMG
jgi:Ca2+-binding EF-hand superfamily protein